MDSIATLMSDLEVAIQGQVPEARVAMLRRVSDLFVDNAAYYASDHVAVFDDVFGRLVQGIEFEGARAAVEPARASAERAARHR